MSDIIDVDPALKVKQNEWVNLLYAEELACSPPPVCELADGNDRAMVASRLYEDAVAGRKVDFPQTRFQIYCYTLTRSKRFLFFYSLVCFFQAILPFFTEPSCPWNEISRGLTYAEYYQSGNHLSHGAMNVLDLLCTLVYCVEVFARLSVNFHLNDIRSRLLYDAWATVRLVCVALLLVDVLVGFGTYSSFLFSRCLLPVIYISRRKSLRQMIHGLLISTRRCLEVFNLVVFLLLLFSVSGFVLFRNINTSTDTNHFSNLGTSLLTCLHIYESRSFNLFISNIYYDHGELSLLFFVLLLVLLDLLSTSFIIAIGNREYKAFATVTFVSELRRRKKALQALFNTLAGSEEDTDPRIRSISTKRISFDMWLLFCAHLRSPYKMSQDVASAVFDMERNKTGRDTVDIVGLARLCAILDAKIELSPPPTTATTSSSDIKSILKLSLRSKTPPGVRSKLTPSLEEIRDSLCDEDSRSVTFAEVLNSLHIKFRILAIKFLKFDINLPAFGGNSRDVNVFSSGASLLRLLSVIQLCCITRSHLPAADARGLFAFGVLLEICFWMEMLLLMSAWSAEMFFFRKTYHSISAGINIVVALLMMAHGDSIYYNNSDGLSLAVIAFQCLRFLRIFRYVRGRDHLQSLIPLILRVLFIILATIYFFAIFAYNRFCSSLKVDQAKDVDDIAASWVDYADVLNFDTLLNSIFTLFQLSVLGSWSMVMQAAALIYPASSLIFFYVYRLLMTIVLYPLLFSFIIQIYTSRSSQTSATVKRKPEKMSNCECSGDVYNDMRVSGDVCLSDMHHPRSSAELIEDRRSSGLSEMSLKKRITIGLADDTNRMMSYWSSDGTALKHKLGGEFSRDAADTAEERLAIVLELKSELEMEVVRLKTAVRELTARGESVAIEENNDHIGTPLTPEGVK